MARIPTYQKDTHISDLDRIIGTDGDTNELATKNFFLGILQNMSLISL